MTAINSAVSTLTTGESQRFENLEITPLLAQASAAADYLTLDEAQNLGLAVVTEVSESGSVPTLLLENNSEKAVFLLDGEELVGAKQNRILNLSILVPARTKLHIPVSCVEQGRWSHRTREFAAAERAHFSRGRARKAARVSENMWAGGAPNSDQGEVWEDISFKMDRMAVSSNTGAIADAYDYFSTSVDEFVAAFHTSDTQVGACFAINGRIRGMELFDVSETCGKLMPKLIRSYALDAIEERQLDNPGENTSVRDYLQAVAASPVDSFQALGEGEDLRIRSTTIAGGALVVREHVVHLCAFSEDFGADTLDRSGRMRRASARRRSRRDFDTHSFHDRQSDIDDPECA